MHILFMLRAEVNIDIISCKLGHCADSEDMKDNGNELIACIRYYWVIVNEALVELPKIVCS